MKKPLTLLTIATAATLAIGFGPRIWAESAPAPANEKDTPSPRGWEHHGPDGPGDRHDRGPGPQGRHDGPGKGGRFGHHDKMGGHGPMMGEMLALTDEQKAQIKSIMDANKPRIDAIRKEQEEKIRAVMEESQKQIRPLLTPAQQQVLDDAQKLREDTKKLHAEKDTPATP